MKIAIVQMNPTIGDLHFNCRQILSFGQKAANANADLVIFPELSLLGYPPKDLLLRRDFLFSQGQFLDEIAKSASIPTIVGAAIMHDDHQLPFNGAFLCHEGRLEIVGKKILLPNYNVFDEKRYFSAPSSGACHVFDVNGKKILLSICEDAWSTTTLQGSIEYDVNPIHNAYQEAAANVDIIVNISASPFSVSKPKIREQIFTTLARTYGKPVLVAGQVGANDQLLFDGHSLIINEQGEVIDRLAPCVEGMLYFEESPKNPIKKISSSPDSETALLDTLAMGIRDYLKKCNIPSVLIGLSGGLDSAVVAALAVRALGPDRVSVVYLPSQYSSEQSFADAELVSANLGLKLDVIPIEEHVEKLRLTLRQAMLENPDRRDIVDQNLQARLRGLIIMSLTNATGAIMLATSNKSELAVGYSTIYGDMCGAISPIGDLYKTEVYQLAHMINKEGQVIPKSIIERPPTAELKPDQRDTDTLPDYAVLDQILFNFIDLEKSASEIVTITSQPLDLINRVITMVSLAEYKRRQGAPCLMVSDKVFGDGRRLPIAKRI